MQMLLLCLSAVSNVATLRNQGSYIRCCGSKHFYYYRSTHDRCCQPPQAIAIGRALEPFNLYFFEDPIEPENMDQWRWVAQQQPIPLAMGEPLYTIYQFRNLLNHQGAAYLRPDLSLAGGITNVKKIAGIAESAYAGVVPADSDRTGHWY